VLDYGIQAESLMWFIGAMVCLYPAPMNALIQLLFAIAQAVMH